MFYDDIIQAVPAVASLINGQANGVRTLVLPFALAQNAWKAPGHVLSEDQARTLLGGSYASTVINLDPALETSYAHQVAVGFDRALGTDLSLAVNGVYVRGFNQVGTIDYNPVLPAKLGAGRRPNDLPCSAIPSRPCLNGGVAGTSASELQYTAFGETWYKGVTVALSKRFSHHYQFLASYTVGKAEDNSTDFQSNFIPQNTGQGRNPADRFGLPLSFNPGLERGPATSPLFQAFFQAVPSHPTGRAGTPWTSPPPSDGTAGPRRSRSTWTRASARDSGSGRGGPSRRSWTCSTSSTAPTSSRTPTSLRS